MAHAVRSRTSTRLWAAIYLAAGLAAADHVRAETALKSPEIEAAHIGKTFRVTTRRVPLGDPSNPSGMTTRTDGGYADVDIFVRPDRSIIFRCTAYARSGASAPCRGSGYTRDVGVWSVEGDHFCYQFLTARGGRKQCYAVLRDGAEFRLRLASGPPSSIDGERLVQQ